MPLHPRQQRIFIENQSVRRGGNGIPELEQQCLRTSSMIDVRLLSRDVRLRPWISLCVHFEPQISPGPSPLLIKINFAVSVFSNRKMRLKRLKHYDHPLWIIDPISPSPIHIPLEYPVGAGTLIFAI